MTTALITHPACERHATPSGHPEQIARMPAALGALEGKDLLRVEAPMATDADLLRVHPQRYIDKIRALAPRDETIALDGDTWMSPGSLEAVLACVGGCIRGVDMVMAGEARNAFVGMRPPGHHAERETPMGFCVFGSVAAAAKHALEVHGLSRVAVLDFDVHHGNGTQDLLESDARCFFASSHQMPLFPGTGHAHETGGHNNVVNLPLSSGARGDVFRRGWEREIFPAVERFEPELILVSAGFDAHAADPLATLNLVEEDFAWVTEAICDLADELCEGRVVSALEGGYDLRALAASVAAHVDVLIARGSG
ncbi:histone deacetylase family protein [Poseidonocella sedimentorum]|uniref:Acetoin utilization deacetylase AcuC n=1 Tax=Poseidonocella sedimentorum TaxID=871652 RepID=A0A1I6DTQ8_9RHOB|nr:histone deacetylase family protein [Poseidonocella sedimentorum]SFR08864.1 Acetoin utilization deacetylase AcuC [Poseidonocella sedimentorum]